MVRRVSIVYAILDDGRHFTAKKPLSGHSQRHEPDHRRPFMRRSNTMLRSTDCPRSVRSWMTARTSWREKPMFATSSITCRATGCFSPGCNNNNNNNNTNNNDNYSCTFPVRGLGVYLDLFMNNPCPGFLCFCEKTGCHPAVKYILCITAA